MRILAIQHFCTVTIKYIAAAMHSQISEQALYRLDNGAGIPPVGGFICPAFKMAAVSPLAEEMLNLSIKHSSLSIGSTLWVYVTHVTDPNDFYVRPSAYNDYLKQLKRYQGPVDPTELVLGSTIVYKSEKKKHHVRGCVRNIRQENGNIVYDLLALDYGFLEPSVPIDKIKKAHDCAFFPMTVIHCTLADCFPKDGVNFDEKAIEAMVYYAGTGKVKMVVRGRMGSKYLVELYDSAPDVATLMALTGYTCLGYDKNVISRMPSVQQPKLYFTYKQLIVGETLKVRIQSGDSLKSFYVCEPEDYKYYLQEYKKTQFMRHDRDFLSDNLLPGKPVGVYSDWYGSYERAIITEVTEPEKSAVVQLVDWGRKMDIHMGMTRLKTLSREYYFMKPAIAVYCTAEEGQVWDNSLHRLLHPGYEVLITVIKVGKEFETPNTVSITKIAVT